VNRLSVSATGVACIVGGVLAYAAGVLLGYRALVVLAVGLLALVVVGVVMVSVRPRVVVIRRVTPERVSVGEPAHADLDVRNGSRWPSPSFTAVDRAAGEPLEVYVSTMAPGGHRWLRYPIPTQRRGRHVIGPLTVERRDALGLFTWAQRQTADGVLWVHPRVHPMRPLPVGVVLDYEGRLTQNARPGTVTFASLREYAPGDDPRHIHWPTTAKTGTLVVREHVDTTEPTTTVVLDTRAERYDPAAFEHAVEVAASVVASVERVGRPAALHITGSASSGGSTLDRLALASLQAGLDPWSLLGLLDRAAPGGALVVVTGDAEPEVHARIAEQRTRFSPVVVIAMMSGLPTVATRRRPGLVTVAARTAGEVVAEWGRL
jgi:uncharacterized protein (DUF58 family)